MLSAVPTRFCAPLCLACLLAAPSDRLLPIRVNRQVVAQLAAEKKWPLGWGFDGRRNIYAPNKFLPQVRTMPCASVQLVNTSAAVIMVKEVDQLHSVLGF